MYPKAYISVLSSWPELDVLGQFFSIIVLVAIVGLLAYLSIRLLSASRNMGKYGANRNLQIIEGLGVGIQSSVQIIRSGDKYFLIGVTKEKITFLTELDKDSVKLHETKNILTDNNFSNILKRFVKKDNENNDS